MAPEEDPESDQEQQIDALDDTSDDAEQDSGSEDNQARQDAISSDVSTKILQTLQSMDSRLQGLESRVTSDAVAIKKLSGGGA